MKSRPALLFVGAAAFFAVLAAGYIGLPWDGDDVREAEAIPSVYGICNVSVSNVPEGVKVAPLPYLAVAGQENTPVASRSLYLLLWVPSPDDQPISTQDPKTGLWTDPRSRVAIDADNGEVVFANYRTSSEEILLGETLASLKVGPWQPAGPAWPRTDTSPTAGEVIEIRKSVEVLTDYDRVTLTYRKPERESGLIVGSTSADSFHHVRAYTCDSIVEIDGRTGSVIRDEVTPDERAMFDRFLSEVRRG